MSVNVNTTLYRALRELQFTLAEFVNIMHDDGSPTYAIDLRNVADALRSNSVRIRAIANSRDGKGDGAI